MVFFPLGMAFVLSLLIRNFHLVRKKFFSQVKMFGCDDSDMLQRHILFRNTLLAHTTPENQHTNLSSHREAKAFPHFVSH